MRASWFRERVQDNVCGTEQSFFAHLDGWWKATEGASTFLSPLGRSPRRATWVLGDCCNIVSTIATFPAPTLVLIASTSCNCISHSIAQSWVTKYWVLLSHGLLDTWLRRQRFLKCDSHGAWSFGAISILWWVWKLLCHSVKGEASLAWILLAVLVASKILNGVPSPARRHAFYLGLYFSINSLWEARLWWCDGSLGLTFSNWSKSLVPMRTTATFGLRSFGPSPFSILQYKCSVLSPAQQTGLKPNENAKLCLKKGFLPYWTSLLVAVTATTIVTFIKASSVVLQAAIEVLYASDRYLWYLGLTNCHL